MKKSSGGRNAPTSKIANIEPAARFEWGNTIPEPSSR